MAAFRTPDTDGRHRPEHVEWLEALVVGDAGPRASEVREELAACPQCSHELASLDSLLGDLDRAGAFERTVLRDAAEESSSHAPHGTPTDPWDRRTSERREPVAASSSTAFGLPWRALALAAAAVLLFVALDSRQTAKQAAPIYLGAEPVAGMEPSGTLPTYPTTFRWELELPIGGWFDLAVFSGDTEGDAEPAAPLFSRSFLKTNEWTWTETELADLPGNIRWEVQVYDATGFPGPKLSARASRSTRDS